MTDRQPTIIARTVTRIVVPLILVTAIALLLQGHNLPGGGFIAGVLTATAFALTYIIYGLDYIESELLDQSVTYPDNLSSVMGRDFAPVFGVGLAIAAGGGLAAMALGYPFLTQGVVFIEGLPLYHELEVASALVFDLGVYFVVVGGILTILAVVGQE
ncbi:MnhB domain-containing protein [Halorientalis marina]|uniref:MnhB domain-containing protein n=1 Tax=Halorientalis marina TaxID=2931976 RepID=UPI001FF10858|nr:MnhB domain-containing protein [Halorientalis marina]